jgi:hypothetical protein
MIAAASHATSCAGNKAKTGKTHTNASVERKVVQMQGIKTRASGAFTAPKLSPWWIFIRIAGRLMGVAIAAKYVSLLERRAARVNPNGHALPNCAGNMG